MKIKHIISFFILFLLVAFHVPKLYYIFSESPNHHILPQFGGPVTSSTTLWLLAHWITSFGLVIFVCAFNLDVNICDNFGTCVFHVIFCGILLFSDNRIGSIDPQTSRRIILVFLAALNMLLFWWEKPRFPLIYTLIVCLPLYAVDLPAFIWYMYNSPPMPFGTITPTIVNFGWVFFSALLMVNLARLYENRICKPRETRTQ